MKMNFESQHNNPDNMNQGERVFSGILAEYYEKSMQLEEQLRNAVTDTERNTLQAELDSVRASMKDADAIASEGKTFPKNDNVYEIPDDMQNAA